MKKRYMWLMISAALALTVVVGSTLAYLIASSNRVENTFTIGDVGISLTETTGSDYKLVPGAAVKKDPTVTVKAKSEACWVFVKVTPSTDLDSFCVYSIADGWTPLEGESGVYYRKVEAASTDTPFAVLKNNQVTVKDSLTEEQLNAVAVKPMLKVTAYAIQSDGMANAKTAWQTLNS